MWIFPWMASPPWLAELATCLGTLFALPFDLARVQHAAQVRSGVLPRSLLESTHFEQLLVALEQLALGPLARRV